MNNRSVPVDIVRDDPELAKVFLGMAVYNHGKITVAYRVPLAFTLSIVDSKKPAADHLFMHPLLLEPGQRLVFDTKLVEVNRG